MLRLITFSRLCLLRDLPDDGLATAAAVAELSCVATNFDCHLLQRSPGAGPLDVLASDTQQAKLRQDVSDGGGNVVVVSSVDPSSVDFPEWLPVTHLGHSPVAQLTEALGQSSTDVGWQWIHIELPEDETADAWLAATLNGAVRLIADFPDDELIVTSVAGEAQTDHRFESLLWEGSIRVPLWFAQPGHLCGQVSQPTGSFDAFETLLAGGWVADALRSQSETGAVDLRSMINAPAERSIHLRHGQTDAVRSPDFFCVRVVDEYSEISTAVYGKPNDVWNVHDLSHEYPDVAEQAFADWPDN